MKESTTLKTGDVVQLNPAACRRPEFGGCMMVISELKKFGAEGYIQSLGENGAMGGVAFYRANWDEMEFVGHAVWVIDS